jgi:hypothetical protein
MNANVQKEKQLYLFLVAFGGHRLTMKQLKEYLRYDAGISHFFFLEYFLLKPLRKIDDFNADVFCPFLERMIKEQQFLANWGSICGKLDESIDGLGEGRITLWPRSRCLERGILDSPLQISSESGWLKFGEDLFAKWKGWQPTDAKSGNSVVICKEYNVDLYKQELGGIRSVKAIEDKEALVKERLVLIYPIFKSGSFQEKEIRITAVPIASDHIFYGYFLVGYLPREKSGEAASGEESDQEHQCGEICTTIKRILDDEVNRLYRPALTLCHHSFYEKECINPDGQGVSIDKGMPFLYGELQYSRNMLEKKIHQLWAERKKYEKKIGKDEIKSNFIFRDRFWASPATIEQIEEAFTWDLSFGDEGTPEGQACEERTHLKTFLVAGGPGSGKETLSKMIGLFSRGHTFFKPHVFNMASFKPDWIAPPSLSGMEIKGKIKNKVIDQSIHGIFEKVFEQLERDRKKQKNKGLPLSDPVIILDELNSLDIDAQGTLLRIIENDEIIPLGGLQKTVEEEDVRKLLIIGVVNELPPQLTLEDSIKTFSEGRSLWGDILAPALYEYYRRMRRLRDDLYYRFKRGGYIALPDLDKRREDIPILFITNLPETIRRQILDGNILIEYDVWDLLTDEKIEWRGNVRQVQAVAHKVAQKVAQVLTKGNTEPAEINLLMVRRVLEEMGLVEKEQHSFCND